MALGFFFFFWFKGVQVQTVHFALFKKKKKKKKKKNLLEFWPNSKPVSVGIGLNQPVWPKSVGFDRLIRSDSTRINTYSETKTKTKTNKKKKKMTRGQRHHPPHPALDAGAATL